MSFPFSHRKTTQALNFFALQSGGEINKLKALKLVFLADRYHLRRHGRPITGDEYFAMPYGPVASGAKDLAEMDPMLSDDERAYATRHIAPVDRNTYRSVAGMESRAMSESDRAALAWTWEQFGKQDGFELAKYTHRYPEWKRHEQALNAKRETRILMSYGDFLDDSDVPGTEPCHPLTPEERDALAAGMKDRFEAERILS